LRWVFAKLTLLVHDPSFESSDLNLHKLLALNIPLIVCGNFTFFLLDGKHVIKIKFIITLHLISKTKAVLNWLVLLVEHIISFIFLPQLGNHFTHGISFHG
jgi:hypothetical protein